MTDVEYLSTIIKGIAGFPDEVKVVRSSDELGILLTVSIAKDDMGRIIGKEGQTAIAIRQILRAYGYNIRARLNMKIAEPVTDL